jgi:hypothetical protein
LPQHGAWRRWQTLAPKIHAARHAAAGKPNRGAVPGAISRKQTKVAGEATVGGPPQDVPVGMRPAHLVPGRPRLARMVDSLPAQ